MRRGVSRYFDIHPAGLADAEERIDAVLDRVAGAIGGRPFLAGDAFTALDLTFAALAAPVLLPEGHGVRLPAVDDLPAEAAGTVRRSREHPAGSHALRMYAKHRAS